MFLVENLSYLFVNKFGKHRKSMTKILTNVVWICFFARKCFDFMFVCFFDVPKICCCHTTLLEENCHDVDGGALPQYAYLFFVGPEIFVFSLPNHKHKSYGGAENIIGGY